MKQLKIAKQITVRDTKSLNKYLTEVSAMADVMTPEEESEIAKKAAEGDKVAIEKLVKSNLRFVISVAKQYQSSGEQLEDLINEGNIGLIKAAEKFDYTRGFKFISYAVWWIRQAIMEYLNTKSRLVRLPGNKISKITKIKNKSAELEQVLNRIPTPYELADALDENLKEVKQLIDGGLKFSSLDSFVADDSTTRLSDLTESKDDIYKTDNNTDIKDLKISLERVINTLDTRERIVIQQSFGILSGEPKTLDEIGDLMGLTRERVRQIKHKALKKMKTNSRKNLLKEFV